MRLVELLFVKEFKSDELGGHIVYTYQLHSFGIR
jgi:hypothetical protein